MWPFRAELGRRSGHGIPQPGPRAPSLVLLHGSSAPEDLLLQFLAKKSCFGCSNSVLFAQALTLRVELSRCEALSETRAPVIIVSAHPAFVGRTKESGKAAERRSHGQKYSISVHFPDPHPFLKREACSENIFSLLSSCSGLSFHW